MKPDLEAMLAQFDQHHLGDPLDRDSFMTLLIVALVIPVVALAAAWMWL